MRHALATICALSLCACTASTEGPIVEQDDPGFGADGKLDTFFAPTLHGELAFGDRGRASLTEDEAFHAWDFTVPGRATITAETSVYRRGGRKIDTVMYLYRMEDGRMTRPYIQRNDDASEENTWSRIERLVRPGTYRLIVKADEGSTLGAFALQLDCAGAGCSATSPTSALRVPVLQEETDALLSEFNPLLTEAGLMPVPDHVDLLAGGEGKEYQDLIEYMGSEPVEALFPDGPAYPRAYGTPDDFAVTLTGGRKVEICYTGEADDIAYLVPTLSDIVFSDQFVVWAYRYGEETWKDNDELTDEELGESWSEFDPHSKDMLFFYTISDSGDDLSWSIISPCAE